MHKRYEKDKESYPGGVRESVLGCYLLIREPIFTTDSHVLHYHDVLSLNPDSVHFRVDHLPYNVLVRQDTFPETLQDPTETWPWSCSSCYLIHGVCYCSASNCRLLYAIQRYHLLIHKGKPKSGRESIRVGQRLWKSCCTLRLVHELSLEIDCKALQWGTHSICAIPHKALHRWDFHLPNLLYPRTIQRHLVNIKESLLLLLPWPHWWTSLLKQYLHRTFLIRQAPWIRPEEARATPDQFQALLGWPRQLKFMGVLQREDEIEGNWDEESLGENQAELDHSWYT